MQDAFPTDLKDRLSAQLFAAVEAFAGASGIDDVIEVLRTQARRLIGADGIAVILREGDQCAYVEEDAVGPLWKGARFSLDACVSGLAMLTRQTIAIADVERDPRVPIDLYRTTFVKSMLMVPVRAADPIGAIGAYWSEVREALPHEIEILERLARATATAIENVRLIAALSRALSDAELARDELRHRVKNAYTAAQSLAVLTLPPEQARTLNARIAALARAHELLDHKLARQDSIELGELIAAELEPYRDEAPGRLTVGGDRIHLASAEAIAFGLAINELATNSLKYGALSAPYGRLEIHWRMDRDHAIVEWRERDGPEVRASAIENFGSRLLRRLVEGQLKGTIRRELAGAGVTCLIEFRPSKVGVAQEKALN